ncbi:HET domain-containing protein [Aspergillus neoniger CBS 115656]|uniref:HET-domain-containing protein n=1 Tax=Aspergillus neoniger (strain CBS 115656) TaxID=1448310 RepID=A0A318YYI9_ASPNB|nr:HET-domain-containing protein [Aspergillus neoniger CBS 115656]PYH37903.1 HET-domain-containing protein [Aspergillus neoniger CBS 115656]
MAAFLRALCCRKNTTDKDKTTSQPVVNEKTGTCSLCSCLRRFDYRESNRYFSITRYNYNPREFNAMLKARHSLFHEQCPSCDDVPKDLLCRFCNHLRPRHLYHYMTQGIQVLVLSFGTFQEIRQRSGNCVLCSIVVQEGYLKGCNAISNWIMSISFRPEYKDIHLEFSFYKAGFEAKCIGGIFDITKRTVWQQPMVDWSTVRIWLENCHREHGGSCDNGLLNSPPHEFRLIDTERGCVVMAPPSCRYATLSYVWGSTADENALATKSTIKILEEEGYLFKTPIPATIKDSIRACIELKIRYLWIDRLCIVQDETTTVKASQINAMGDIYSHSYLTLVDLEGVTMDHGLPGVSQARASHTIHKACGLSMRAMEDSFPTLVKKSKWASRGWTFQEAMLSTRMLFFTDAGVFFECSQASQEDRFALSTSRQLQFPPVTTYDNLVHELSSRSFTINSDVLRAFSGIMHWKYGTEHYFGLPYCEFVRGMLWDLYKMSAHETPVARRTETGDIFPTWSWSSVMGPVYLHMIESTHTSLLGVWGTPSSRTNETVHIIWPHNRQLSRDKEDGWVRELGIVLAWKEGCFPRPLPPILNVSTTWQEYRALLKSGWASFDKLNEEALGLAYLQGEEDIENIFSSSYMEHANQPGALLAHTQSLEARMIQWEDNKNEFFFARRFVQVILHGMRDDRVDLWIHSHPAHWQFLDHDYSTDHDTKLNVLALSMSHQYYFHCGYDNRDKQGRWYDPEGSVLCSFDGKGLIFLVDVLIVETRDGLSRRVTIGRVELHDWISASPKFRNFILV